MPEFENPIDPSTLPHRRCSKCEGEMAAVAAGSQSFSPIARYACASCDHKVKIVPLSATGSSFGMAFLAAAIVTALIYFLSRTFEALDAFWVVLVMVVFMGPFIPDYLRARRHPVIGGEEAPASAGFLGNLIFLIVLFVVVLGIAALVGWVWG